VASSTVAHGESRCRGSEERSDRNQSERCSHGESSTGEMPLVTARTRHSDRGGTGAVIVPRSDPPNNRERPVLTD
jgi:hypothetical protein